MISRLYSIFCDSGEALVRGGSFVLNTRLTALAAGILTTWYLGAHRARCLQMKWGTPPSHTLSECRSLSCPPESLEVKNYYTHLCEDHWSRKKTCTTEHFSRGEHHYHAVVHQPLTRVDISLWKQCSPVSNAGELTLYGLLVFQIAWGGGRLPLTSRSLAYVVTQIGTKFLDSLVLAICILGPLDRTQYNGVKWLKPYPTTKGWRRRSVPAVMLGLAYFGLRIVDGYRMAAEPLHIPFESIFKQLSTWRQG